MESRPSRHISVSAFSQLMFSVRLDLSRRGSDFETTCWYEVVCKNAPRGYGWNDVGLARHKNAAGTII